jgi:hypothetical protein
MASRICRPLSRTRQEGHFRAMGPSAAIFPRRGDRERPKVLMSVGQDAARWGVEAGKS